MQDLIALIAFVSGIPMLLIGYIWLLVRSKKFGAMWVVANLIVVPVVALFVIDWNKAWPALRVPLILTVIGFAMVMYTLESVG